MEQAAHRIHGDRRPERDSDPNRWTGAPRFPFAVGSKQRSTCAPDYEVGNCTYGNCEEKSGYERVKPIDEPNAG